MENRSLGWVGGALWWQMSLCLHFVGAREGHLAGQPHYIALRQLLLLLLIRCLAAAILDLLGGGRA